MFGTRANLPRPVLMIIVYGLFLVIVGVTATAQTMLVSLHFSTASLEATVGSDAATIRTFANGFLQQSDLTGATPARVAELETALDALLHRGELLRVDLRSTTGTVLFTTEPTARGQVEARSAGFDKAVGASGEPAVDAALLDGSQPTEAPGAPLGASQVLRAYFPLVGQDGKAQAVIAIYRDAAPLFAKLAAIRLQVVLVTLSAAAIVAVLLFFIFRAAQRRITVQTAQLVESTRRDPLTGLLNHGALVGSSPSRSRRLAATGRRSASPSSTSTASDS